MSSSLLASTEVATVAKVGDMYHIEIVTVEQSLIPIHPDKGFFPKVRREIQFVTSGPGERITVADREYQRFVINRDAVTVLDNCVYSDGEIRLSEKFGELIFRGNLSSSHSEYANHSGHYRGVQFLHPEIVRLDKDVVLSAIPGAYVTATGSFGDGWRTFIADGVSYEALDWGVPKNNEPIWIVARVIVPTASSRSPYLFILKKTRGAERKCGPAGQ